MNTYGYICFAYSKNEWIAKAIAWFTKSRWSHSFITVPDMLGEQMAMESDSYGVSIISFDQGYRENPNQAYQMYRFKIPQEQIDKAILDCINKLETPYGYLEYPWFVWRSINFWFGRDIKKNNNWSQQGTICSGLVRFYIESAGHGDLFQDFGKDSMSAEDVYRIVLSRPDLFELVEGKI